MWFINTVFAIFQAMSLLPNNHKDPDIPKGNKMVDEPVDHLQLWGEFRKGSEAAFIEIYNQYFQVLYDYSFRLTSNRPLCKDCIQELFYKLRKNRSALPSVQSPKAFLIKSIRNQLLNEIKKSKRSASLNEASVNQPFLVTPSHETVIIARQFSQSQLRRISWAIAKLTAHQREAIHFFFYEELGYAEIADIMGMTSTRAARNLIYRSLKAVRLSLDKWYIFNDICF